MINVAIVGATGYTGLELSRLLLNHPKVKIKHLYENSNSGSVFSDLYPQFKSKLDLKLEVFKHKSLPSVDVLFLAIPHVQSHMYVIPYNNNKRVLHELTLPVYRQSSQHVN